MKKSILWIFAFVLLLQPGCRSESEAQAHEAFKNAFDRQEEALVVLRDNRESPEKALKALKKLRSTHGDEIIAFREQKIALKEALRTEDAESLGKNRDRIFEELNTVLSDYPASQIKEIRYLLQTL